MKPTTRLHVQLAGQVIAFCGLATTIVLLWRDNRLLFLVMLLEALIALALWHERYDLSFFLVIASLGSLAETFFVHFGVWRYGNPTLLGVPLWFPLAFGTAGLIGERLVQTVTTLWEASSPSKISRITSQSPSHSSGSESPG